MTPGRGLPEEALWFVNGLGVRDTGELDRDLPTGAWLVPAEVRVKGDVLQYRWATSTERPRRPPQQTGVLDGLLEATGGDVVDGDAVATFARRWGVIEVCPHGLPATHRPARSSSTGPQCSIVPVRQDRRRLVDWWQEPLSSWGDLGKRARAMLTVAATVHDQKPAPLETWREAAWDLPMYSGSQSRFIAASERPAMAAAVNGWLTIGGVGVEYVWEGDRPTLTLRPRSLVGAIGLQLAFSAARTDGLRLCFNCGRPYTPERTPAPNRRNYCKDCGLKAAQRQAARDYRERKKKEKSNG